MAKSLERALSARRKPLAPGRPDDRLHFAAARALGDVGPEGARVLVRQLDEKTFRANLALRERIALSLGKTAVPEGVQPLLSLLDHREARLQAAAATALGYYGKAEGPLRKRIFRALLKVLAAQQAAREADPSDLAAQARWQTCAGPLVASLQLVSGHHADAPEAWQRWWKEHGKREWGGER